jgi:hypothetical protein
MSSGTNTTSGRTRFTQNPFRKKRTTASHTDVPNNPMTCQTASTAHPRRSGNERDRDWTQREWEMQTNFRRTQTYPRRNTQMVLTALNAAWATAPAVQLRVRAVR